MSNFITRVIFLGTLALATIFSPLSVAGDTLQRVVDFKVLNVGMSGTQPPMNVVNKRLGHDTSRKQFRPTQRLPNEIQADVAKDNRKLAKPKPISH